MKILRRHSGRAVARGRSGANLMSQPSCRLAQKPRQLRDIRRDPPRLGRMYAGRGHKRQSRRDATPTAYLRPPRPCRASHDVGRVVELAKRGKLRATAFLRQCVLFAQRRRTKSVDLYLTPVPPVRSPKSFGWKALPAWCAGIRLRGKRCEDTRWLCSLQQLLS